LDPQKQWKFGSPLIAGLRKLEMRPGLVCFHATEHELVGHGRGFQDNWTPYQKSGLQTQNDLSQNHSTTTILLGKVVKKKPSSKTLNIRQVEIKFKSEKEFFHCKHRHGFKTVYKVLKIHRWS
jgi:hypothetical protein